jgi:hypothetical protein
MGHNVYIDLCRRLPMKKHSTLLSLILFALLISVLACRSPQEFQQSILGTATIGPGLLTPEPSDRTPTPGAAVTPTAPPLPTPAILADISQWAAKDDFSSDGISCPIQVWIQLVVNSDGTAVLSTTGPNITDHYNCTPNGEETWYINGTADAANQLVTFTSCNFGGFTAIGSVTYSGNLISGAVSCYYPDNTKAVTITTSE